MSLCSNSNNNYVIIKNKNRVKIIEFEANQASNQTNPIIKFKNVMDTLDLIFANPKLCPCGDVNAGCA